MYNNPAGMTQLMFQYARGGKLTIEEAKYKLHANAYIRTAGETLARYCGVSQDDPVQLKRRLTALLSESAPWQKRDSIDKKVRTWVNRDIQYIGRDSALQLAFALRLKTKDAEEMLWRLCGEGFHWRDPHDIVWLFALEHRLTYADACELYARMFPANRQPRAAIDNPGTMTEVIKPYVRSIQNEEQLRLFLREAAPHLGTLRNTAYKLFMHFMELLKSASMEDNLPESRKMPASEILATYLYNNMIPRSKRKRGSKKVDKIVKDAIQRDIQQNWPDEFALTRMARRETNVTRKVLILLFLACDGGKTQYGDHSFESPEDIFEDTYSRLSRMLADCGFPPLDPRTPFDWMVLYCMVADDLTEIDENILRFLSAIFQPAWDG